MYRCLYMVLLIASDHNAKENKQIYKQITKIT
jgi:hypothetical protein